MKSALFAFGKWLLRILGSLLAAGLIYQFVAVKVDEARYPAPGQLVTVQNARLHIYCVGQGRPIILIEAAEGDIGLQFQTLMGEIGQFTRVCTYDRPGTGWSDPRPGFQAAEESAVLFHEALQSLGEAGPYIVAGHSIGGIYSQAFARLHPAEVVGMVLIDSVAPDMALRMPPAVFAGQRQALTLLRLCQVTTPFGLPRLLGLGKVAEASGLSSATRLALEATVYKYHACGELVKALQAAESMLLTPGPKPDFGDLPLIVLVRDEKVIYAKNPGHLSPEENQQAEKIWLELQREQAQMSSRGELLVAENSAHYIYLDRSDLVLESLRRVMEMAANR